MSSSHSHSALILGAIQHVTPKRLQKAVCGLADGTLTVTLTRTSKAEIRGLVRNGKGAEYGVALTASLTACSCKDALYRGVVCKHAVALALSALRPPKATAEGPRPDTSHMIHLGAHSPAETAPVPTRTIHLVLASGTPLCGTRTPTRGWRWPCWPETAWPETCVYCAALRTRPVGATAA
jgi:hypothetical protein